MRFFSFDALTLAKKTKNIFEKYAFCKTSLYLCSKITKSAVDVPPTLFQQGHPNWAFGNFAEGSVWNWHTGGLTSLPTNVNGEILHRVAPSGVNQVWGYNLFAQYSNAARTAGSRTPRIAISLSEVFVAQNVRIYDAMNNLVSIETVSVPHPQTRVRSAYTDEQLAAMPPAARVANRYVHSENSTLFISVKSFQGHDAQTGFLPGRVYRIDDLVFNIEPVTEIPFIQPLSVRMSVSVPSWSVISVNPDW